MRETGPFDPRKQQKESLRRDEPLSVLLYVRLVAARAAFGFPSAPPRPSSTSTSTWELGPDVRLDDLTTWKLGFDVGLGER